MSRKFRRLFAYQRSVLRWAAPLESIALFLQMRLGKTLIAIRWANSKSDTGKLVVAPASVLPVWKRELEEEGYPSTLLLGTQKQRLELLKAGQAAGHVWFLINWEGLLLRGVGGRHWVAGNVCQVSWQTVILDESTRIKNPRARISKFSTELLSLASYKAILSGLPNPESDLEFYQQMSFLHSHWMGCKNFWVWRDRHFVLDYYTWTMRPASRLLMHDLFKKQAYRLTRRQAGLVNKKVWQERYVELPPAVRASYRKAERDWILGEDPTKFAIVRHTWLSRIAGGALPNFEHNAKSAELMNLLLTDLRDQQTVVWFRYLKEMDQVAKLLKSHGISFRKMNGATPLHVRESYGEDFEIGEFHVFLVQAKVGAFGLDMSAASTSVYYSFEWSGQVWGQSQDRIIHPQKKEPLHYIALLAKDTIDEDTYDILKGKGVRSLSFLENVVARLQARYKRK